MKYILFCTNTYSFGILSPFIKIFKKKNYNWVWYVDKKIQHFFPFPNEKYTSKISDLILFRSDVILVPGNDVPHYLRGVKTQVFHGFAGEKKGHFRVRDYFDLYLTQGPYFTSEFNRLKKLHGNFEVMQTGWPKFDKMFKNKKKLTEEKYKILKKYDVQHIVLYAPTFSPSLTSAESIIPEIIRIARSKKNILFLIKFHPLMHPKYIKFCKQIENKIENINLIKKQCVLDSIYVSDLMISDTSSTIYESLLMDKPVISFNSISKNIVWDNFSNIKQLEDLIDNNLDNDPFKSKRKIVYQNYHPYNDGQSAERMIDSINIYIKKFGIPNYRNLSPYRKFKIYLKFGFNNIS